MKVKFTWRCKVGNYEDYEIVEVEDDITQEELEAMAEDMMWENLGPDFEWEEVDDDDDEDEDEDDDVVVDDDELYLDDD